MISVVICEDHQIVRNGLRQILTGRTDIAIRAEVENAEKLVVAVREQTPDVVLLDVGLPGRSGLDVMKQLRHVYPQLKFLILSMYPEEQFALRMFKAGANGYLHKDIAPNELVNAIHQVAKGEKYLSPKVAEIFFEQATKVKDKLPHELLSDREYEVMILLGQGKTNGEIAQILNLSAKTISTYRFRIFEKMGLENLTDLVQYLLEHNLIIH